jgi:hypothetical protein
MKSLTKKEGLNRIEEGKKFQFGGGALKVIYVEKSQKKYTKKIKNFLRLRG